jgi:hypothetical protein
MSAKLKSVLLKVDLGHNGGTVSFRSIEEVEEWVNHEVQYWQWLQKSATFDRETAAIWTQQCAPWNKVIEKINRLKSNLGEQESSELYKGIEQILTNAYGATKSLHSSTPQAKRLLEFSSDPSDQKAILTAAYMLGYFINAPFKVSLQRPESVPTVIVALQEASLFSKGITGVSPAELNAIAELRANYTKLNEEFRQQIQDNKGLFEKSVEQFQTLAGNLTEKFAGLFDTSKKTLEDIANTYDKKLALQASVSYWTTKASRHRNFSIAFGFLFVLSLLTVGYLFFQEVYPLLKDASPDKPIPYWVLALILIGAVISIWIVRLVVRVLLSHIHLQRDASERSTMLLTYLALLREGAGLKEDDKKLILQALFRPSSSGIVKDDALPSGMYDLITKLK